MVQVVNKGGFELLERSGSKHADVLSLAGLKATKIKEILKVTRKNGGTSLKPHFSGNHTLTRELSYWKSEE